jgi:hypothetical protein
MFCYVLLIGPIGPIDFLRALYQRLDQLACRSCAPRPIISYTGTCREKAKTWNAPATPEASRSPPTTGTYRNLIYGEAYLDTSCLGRTGYGRLIG